MPISTTHGFKYTTQYQFCNPNSTESFYDKQLPRLNDWMVTRRTSEFIYRPQSKELAGPLLRGLPASLSGIVDRLLLSGPVRVRLAVKTETARFTPCSVDGRGVRG